MFFKRKILLCHINPRFWSIPLKDTCMIATYIMRILYTGLNASNVYIYITAMSNARDGEHIIGKFLMRCDSD